MAEQNQPEAPASEPRKPPTSNDVARRAGVSQATVSYVLNNQAGRRVSPETAARVRAAADELGYTTHALAQSLRVGQSRLILLQQLDLPHGPMVVRFYQEIAERLGALGYTIVLHMNQTSSGLEAARRWASLRPIGLVAQANHVDTQALELLRVSGVQSILLLDTKPSALASTLTSNDEAIGACAARHLLDQGYRRLAAIMPGEAALYGLGNSRAQGFRAEAERHGHSAEVVSLFFDANQAHTLAEGWRQGQHPDAVFTYNDEYGALLLGALLDAGFAVPGEIGLIGADNLPLCTLVRPHLSSIDKGDSDGLARAAAYFHEMIQQPNTPPITIALYEPQVCARTSSARTG